MTTVSNTSLSRRHLVSTALVGAATFTMTGPGSAQDATPDSGEWSFTDDKGVTTTLPSRPQRLVVDLNAAAPLWDFGIRPDALFGWSVMADGSLGSAGGNIDPEGIDIVGDVSLPVDIEKLIAADPDVIITLTLSPETENEYWSIDASLVSQLQAVAPIIAISATGRADENARRFAELASALGADQESADFAEAEAAFNDAFTDFGKVVEEKSDLSVLFIAPTAESSYIANPGDFAELHMYEELGLNIVKPDVAAGAFWEAISHEQALKYPADVIFYSTLNKEFGEQEIKDSPGWGNHPAVKAGQLFGWNQDCVQSYAGLAKALKHTAESVESSSKTLWTQDSGR